MTAMLLGGQLDRLMAAVRAEFRGDVLVFPATDPVLDVGPCPPTAVASSKLSQLGAGR